MKTIAWKATTISFGLLGNYPEILLYLSATLSIISIISCFVLSRRVKRLEDNSQNKNKLVNDAIVDLIKVQQDIRELFRIVEPNADNIAMLQVQMDKVNELLGTVMGASDLVGFNSPEERVEEMKNRLKWERERRRLNKFNPSDYYQG